MKYRKPYRVKKKKSLLKSRYFWRLVLGLIFAGEIFYVIYFFSYFQIKEIKVIGNEKVRSEAIKNFVPLGSIFLVDSKKITGDILNYFPQVAEVKTDRKFPDKLFIHITEREANAAWCYKDSPCFIADKNGVVFEKLPQLPHDYINIKDFDRRSEPVLGEKIIEPDLLASIRDIAEKASDMGITPEVFTILPEGRLNMKIVDSGEVYFNPQGDLRWQLTKLKAVLEKEIPENRRKNIEYIDLRFGNLAPYKYR